MTSSTVDANRNLALELFGRLDGGDLDGALALLHPDFVSHNPRVAHDPATATGLAAGADVRRIVADDPLVAVHNRIALPTGDVAAVDILRVQDGLVVEHWDVVQPVPEEPANPHGMF
jgi:predicted SnoaL-like aldol condensation-catalyzing enzyme